MEVTRSLYVATRKTWRTWLERHHADRKEIWLIYYKKDSGRPRIPYDDAVEEALCFGWVDSIVKRIDDKRFAQRFSPRRAGSAWSPSNIARMRRLIPSGQVTAAGLAVYDPKRVAAPPPKRPARLRIAPVLASALRADARAQRNFLALPRTERLRYLHWVSSAKRAETRERRAVEAVALLRQNRKLGLK